MSVCFGLLQALSCAVIHSDFNSAGLAASFTDFTIVAVSVSRLVPNLVNVLLSLTLLTGTVLYSLDLGSSARLLLIYMPYFSDMLFLAKTILVFLICLAVLQILYRPVKTQVRL